MTEQNTGFKELNSSPPSSPCDSFFPFGLGRTWGLTEGEERLGIMNPSTSTTTPSRAGTQKLDAREE